MFFQGVGGPETFKPVTTVTTVARAAAGTVPGACAAHGAEAAAATRMMEHVSVFMPPPRFRALQGTTV